jgi:hypothetical protein
MMYSNSRLDYNHGLIVELEWMIYDQDRSVPFFLSFFYIHYTYIYFLLCTEYVF